jgi:hypothetical protein
MVWLLFVVGKNADDKKTFRRRNRRQGFLPLSEMKSAFLSYHLAAIATHVPAAENFILTHEH